MNYARSKLRGIRTNRESLAQLSPPHVSSGGPVLTSPGFPLKACGNDGLRKGNKFYGARCGEFTPERSKDCAGDEKAAVEWGVTGRKVSPVTQVKDLETH